MRTTKLDAKIRALLVEIGFRHNPSGFYPYEINTEYGILGISLHEPRPRQKIFNVFSKFYDSQNFDLIPADVGQTGKWNHFYFLSDMTDAQIIEDLTRELSRVIPVYA